MERVARAYRLPLLRRAESRGSGSPSAGARDAILLVDCEWMGQFQLAAGALGRLRVVWLVASRDARTPGGARLRRAIGETRKSLAEAHGGAPYYRCRETRRTSNGQDGRTTSYP